MASAVISFSPIWSHLMPEFALVLKLFVANCHKTIHFKKKFNVTLNAQLKHTNVKIWCWDTVVTESVTVSFGVWVFTQCNIFQLHPCICRFHEFIFLYSWLKFHCTWMPRFHYLSPVGDCLGCHVLAAQWARWTCGLHSRKSSPWGKCWGLTIWLRWST